MPAQNASCKLGLGLSASARLPYLSWRVLGGAYRPALRRVVRPDLQFCSACILAEHHFCSPQTRPLQLPGTPALFGASELCGVVPRRRLCNGGSNTASTSSHKSRELYLLSAEATATMAPRRAAVLLLPALISAFRAPSFARRLPRLPKAETATAEATQATPEKVKLVEGFGVGIRRDVKARLPYYKSDIKDGVSVKSVSALLYLFFACLAPAVAFGSVQGATTKGAIGAVEYVASTAICGVVYALASAQPLTIIGSTGPVLAFTSVLYGLSTKLGVPFLPLYAWTGLWSSLYLFLGALFSTSNGVTLLTRFTDEIFSNLISTIFVYEAARDVVFGALLNPTVAAGEAFAVAATACTTFGSATWLAARRGAESLKRGVRNFLADFAPAIGICLGILAGGWCGARAGVPLQKLAMPATFSTTSGRPWLVPLGALPVKYRWLASLPALMVAVLLFFDQNITVRIVNAESNKLKKPVGYHQDLLVVSLLAAGCSVVGFPWLVAATVRSINHVRANSVYEM